MQTTGAIRPGTRFSRGLAIFGILLLASPFMFLGVISWVNYDGWKKGRDKYPIVAWFSAWFGISGLFAMAVAYIIAGSKGVGRFGSVGTVIMLVGGVLGAFATWWYDQAAAEHPTLKASPGSVSRQPLLPLILKIVGLALAGAGVLFAVYSFATDLFPADSTIRTSFLLILVGGGVYLGGTLGFTSPDRQE